MRLQLVAPLPAWTTRARSACGVTPRSGRSRALSARRSFDAAADGFAGVVYGRRSLDGRRRDRPAPAARGDARRAGTHERRPPARHLGVALAVLIALRVAGELTRDGSAAQGPPGSSYAYGEYGASAYAACWGALGRQVARLRDRPRDLDLDPRSTVVVLCPDVITPDDAAALGRLLAVAAALIADDSCRARWLARSSGPPSWSDARSMSLTRSPRARDLRRAHDRIRRRRPLRQRRLRSPRRSATRPRRSPPSGACGAGRVVLLADASPLLNGRLAERDDAASRSASQVPAGRSRSSRACTGKVGRGGWGALPGRFRGALGAARPGRGRDSCWRAGGSGPRARRAGARTGLRQSTPTGWRARCCDRLAGGGDRAGCRQGAPTLVVSPGRATTRCSRQALGGGLSEDEARAIAHGAPRARPRLRPHVAWHASTSGGERRR